MNQYEAMFVFDPTFGAAFEQCETEVGRLMERAHAEVLMCKKWDERRLAYRIKGRKRGVYVLVYFKSPTESIAPLERDAQLSEHILRLLVLRADGYTAEHMERSLNTGGEESSGPSHDRGAVGERTRSRETSRAPAQRPAAAASETAVAEKPESDKPKSE